ncbi:flagellar basal body P-ring formation chaperone FlgA [Vibrio mexicanus]|uniref:flagellar basal body P-ring formation chaperone FlgA n=1 Tax=Vibrio mexicanus TaxID=1004326 RepID=UPI00063C0AE3|nr:flagellar basal body P-ring formation chaperone FlgA [Vibrio mexicanus]
MPYFKLKLDSFSITKCRAFYNIFYPCIGFFLIFFSVFTYSATPEQILQMQNAAENHVLSTVPAPAGGQLEVKAANLDRRLFATDCPEELATSSSSTNPSASNITVLVACESDNWRVYVPVRLSVSAPQVTAATNLDRGQIISENDVTMSMVDLHRFRRQGFSSTNLVLGAKLKKNIRVGEVIETRDICVVCRNETVMIRAVNDGMQITTRGVALSDGSHGEQIRVKNSRSNRIIDARVSGIAEVTVQF